MRILFPEDALAARTQERMRRVFEHAPSAGECIEDQDALQRMSLGELLYHALFDQAEA